MGGYEFRHLLKIIVAQHHFLQIWKTEEQRRDKSQTVVVCKEVTELVEIAERIWEGGQFVVVHSEVR